MRQKIRGHTIVYKGQSDWETSMMETALSPQHRDLSLRPWARLPLWIQDRQGLREEKVAAGTLTFTVEGWRLAFWPQLST